VGVAKPKGTNERILHELEESRSRDKSLSMKFRKKILGVSAVTRPYADRAETPFHIHTVEAGCCGDTSDSTG